MRLRFRHARVAATILALGNTPLLAVGIAALKEQPFHADASANVLIYQNKVDNQTAPFVKFVTASREVMINRSLIVATLELPDSIPDNITAAEQTAPLRQALADLSAFARRFPKAAAPLAKQIQALAGHLQKFDGGQVRYHGKWITAAEYAALNAQSSKEEQQLREAQLARMAEKKRARDEAEAFAARQHPQASGPQEATAAELEVTASLGRDIAAAWQGQGAAAGDLPPHLPSAVAERLTRWLPQRKVDPAEIAKDRHPGLLVAFAVDQALRAQPPDLHAIAAWCDRARSLPAHAAPWLARFQPVLDRRRAQALAWQQQAIDLLANGDCQAAEARLAQAASEFPSPGLSGLASALTLFDRLVRDRAFRTGDGGWQAPAMPDPALLQQATAQAVALRDADGPEILPALTGLAAGLDAAGMLEVFLRASEPAGSNDRPHPIRALRVLRQKAKFRALLADPSPFVTPFLIRLRAVDAQLGTQADTYGQRLDQARELEADGKFLAAAAQYRLANGIESSQDLEQSASNCEARASGL